MGTRRRKAPSSPEMQQALQDVILAAENLGRAYAIYQAAENLARQGIEIDGEIVAEQIRKSQKPSYRTPKDLTICPKCRKMSFGKVQELIKGTKWWCDECGYEKVLPVGKSQSRIQNPEKSV